MGDIGLAITSDEEIEAGTPPSVEFHIPLAIPVPVGPQQAIGAPLGILTLNLSKAEAAEFFEQGAAAVEKLPEPKPASDIMIASNVNDAVQVAQEMKKVTGT
jgi:hypothetical protein